jgi:hypothetical protein
MLMDKIDKKINQEKNKNIVIKRMKTKNKFKKTNAIKSNGKKLQKKKNIIKKSIKQKNRVIKSRGTKSDKKSN